MEHNLYLVHHGIKGMKWGVRRYQNPDGTLTPEGLKRYSNVKSPTKESKAKTISSTVTAGATIGGVAGGVAGGLLGGSAGALAGVAINAIQEHRSNQARTYISQHFEAQSNTPEHNAKLKKEAQRLERNADGYLSECKARATKGLNDRYSRELADPDAKAYLKTQGINNAKQFNKHVMDGVKLLELADDDRSVSQHINIDYDTVRKGYLSKNTFNKYYSAELYNEAMDVLGYHYSMRNFDDDVYRAKSFMKQIPESNRQYWFNEDEMSFLKKQGVY